MILQTPNLDEGQASAARLFHDAVTSGTGVLAGRYVERFGNRISPDLAAELFPDYSRSLIIVGGPYGCGKESVVEELSAELARHTHAIFSTSLDSLRKADEVIARALETRRQTVVAFVHRPLARAVSEAVRLAAATGRAVPLSQIVKEHRASAPTFRWLADRYRGERTLTFGLIDTPATTGPGWRVPRRSASSKTSPRRHCEKMRRPRTTPTPPPLFSASTDSTPRPPRPSASAEQPAGPRLLLSLIAANLSGAAPKHPGRGKRRPTRPQPTRDERPRPTPITGRAAAPSAPSASSRTAPTRS